MAGRVAYSTRNASGLPGRMRLSSSDGDRGRRAAPAAAGGDERLDLDCRLGGGGLQEVPDQPAPAAAPPSPPYPRNRTHATFKAKASGFGGWLRRRP
jgi:hypothetical protein